MKQQEQVQIENAFKVLEKEGNKVARDKTLPPGKNADAGWDVAAFNAGMRYAMARLKTSMKQIQEGKYQIVEFPKQGQHALPAKGTTTATKAPAKKASAKKATKVLPSNAEALASAATPPAEDGKVVDISVAKAPKPRVKKIAKRA